MHTIAENGPLPDVPNRANDPVGAARFWIERNVDRWQAAVELESTASLAVCDTDPLKLHYIWCLWQIGEAKEGDWLLELQATRDAVARRRIGFADRYYVRKIEPHAAREQARADRNRRRRNFELHVRLQPALLHWYAALGTALPGRVQFLLPSALPHSVDATPRYDLPSFDRFIEALTRHSPLPG